jgi:predicted HicB family RNase H-like nuclease
MREPKRKPKPTLTLEVDRRLKAKLTRLAIAQERSVSQVVRILLKKSLEEERKSA